MYCAFVETVGVWGVEGVEGVDGAEEVGGVDGAEFSVPDPFPVSLEGGDASELLSDETGGVEEWLSSAATQANEGSRNVHAKRSAAKDFAFFIKIPHKFILKAIYRFVCLKIKRCIQR